MKRTAKVITAILAMCLLASAAFASPWMDFGQWFAGQVSEPVAGAEEVVLTIMCQLKIAGEDGWIKIRCKPYPPIEPPWPPEPPQPVPQMDVVFVIDSTGSMHDEIMNVKQHIVQTVEEIRNGNPRPDVRIGIVTYRDHELEEDEYLMRSHELTRDIDEVLDWLMDIEADGGGDGPEAVADGLDEAINGMNWRPVAVPVCGNGIENEIACTYPMPMVERLVFLIGDAPPHGLPGNGDRSYRNGCPHGHSYQQNIADANRMRIRIYTIGGSGIGGYRHGEDVFKEIAHRTGGTYSRLNYMRVDPNDYYAQHGITGQLADPTKDRTYDPVTKTIQVNNLLEQVTGATKARAEAMGVKY